MDAVTGRRITEVAYVRYNVDGSLDETFADEGKGFVRFRDDATRNQATSVVVRADGSSVIGGRSSSAGAPATAAPAQATLRA